MMFIVATALVLDCIVSATLLFRFYRQSPPDRRVFFCVIAYYVCLILVAAIAMLLVKRGAPAPTNEHH